MSFPLYVAFIWHQHQPLYKSRFPLNGSSENYRLPWVRLHGTKDYLDLILILEKYPNLHQTVNLVPSLILQLEDYVAGNAIDPYLSLALSDEKTLNSTQKEFIIEHFFDGNHHTLVDPHPRYSQLYENRHEYGPKWCLENWQDQDYGDLLAWHNLAWFDPLFWDDPEIANWLKKDRGFTLVDRQNIYKKQQEIIARIIPQHRKMQETGQLEITTTPYTHPILPLLADTNAGRVAVPKMTLPETRFQYEEDIPRHLEKATTLYVDRFGQTPRGIWPSEQSVSPAILPYIKQAGFNWLCSDEAVLGWTLKHFFHRDDKGNLYEPELLYRPYRLETPNGDLSIVFRDHRLSDLIGFTYGAMAPDVAAKDLIYHLEAICENVNHRQPNQPALVTIALDGENCWEYYQQDGLPFLTALYEKLSHHRHIKLVTVSEYLEQYPARETLPSDQLHSGSWVDGSFTTWIGDPAKNRAWDLLNKARQLVAKYPEETEEKNPELWEALYAAEGSDWFWWFGEGHSSNQDAMFDQLFREHLCCIYKALNHPIPEELFQYVESHERKESARPQSFIHPFINGIGDEQDWDKAGRIEIGGAGGTMHKSSAVQRLFYGLDHLNFYLRVDCKMGLKPAENLPNELHLFWYYPGVTLFNSPICLSDLAEKSPLNYLYHHHVMINLKTGQIELNEAGENYCWFIRSNHIQVGVDQCIEIGIPWSDLHLQPDYPLELVAILAENGSYKDTLNESEFITFQTP